MTSIVVNARFLTQKITGVQRFAIEMSKHLKEIHPEIRFVSPPDIMHQELSETLAVEITGKLTSHLWEQIELPVYLRRHGAPLLINFGNTAPLFYRYQIVTIHDLSFLINREWFSKPFIIFYSFLIPKIIIRSRRIITVSENSSRDIQQLIGIKQEKITVIPCSISDKFRRNHSTGQSVPYNNYVLAVSSLDPRKNFVNLIKAFNTLTDKDIRLVIVGSANRVFGDTNLKQLIESNPAIVFTGYVSDDELVTLYRNARLFLYPSLYEGFGIPPLEAMACGCPTIVSNTSSLPEVCGDASYYVSPTDISGIAQGIQTVLADQQLRDTLIRKGLSRVALFDWNQSARTLAKVIHTIQQNYAVPNA